MKSLLHMIPAGVLTVNAREEQLQSKTKNGAHVASEELYVDMLQESECKAEYCAKSCLHHIALAY